MNVGHIDLTAAEIGYLWSTYHAQSMNYCLLKYFDFIAEDEKIKALNKKALESSVNCLEDLKRIFKNESFPIPGGFSDSDIHPTKEKLYNDSFILYYQWFIAKGNLNFSAIAINTVAREDVFAFFKELTSNSLNFVDESRALLLEKGLWVRAPYIPVPEKVEFVKKESFLNGWFGDRRPLLGVEIASVFYNLLTNTIGLHLTNSFIQVTKDDGIRKYFDRGKNISSSHIDILGKILKEGELAAPSTWNPGVTTSTESPFSERLMLSMISFLNSQGLNNYGIAVATSSRRDIALHFSRLAAEVATYADDGISMLIELGWMEAPPHAPKR